MKLFLIKWIFIFRIGMKPSEFLDEVVRIAKQGNIQAFVENSPRIISKLVHMIMCRDGLKILEVVTKLTPNKLDDYVFSVTANWVEEAENLSWYLKNRNM